MPTFEITGPDGKRYRVTGANAEGALAALRSSQGAQPTPAADVSAEPAPEAAPAKAAAPTAVYEGALLPLTKMSDGTRQWSVPTIISDTFDALRLPEKVARGEVDPMSDEGMRDVLGLAGIVTGSAFPRAGSTVLDGAGRAVPKAVRSALKADGVPIGEVASRVQELGPAGTVADLGPNLRNKTAALATTPGRAQDTVVDALRARQKEAPARLTGALDETLGPAPVPSYVEREVKGNMRTLGPEYDKALEGAGPVDTKPVADAMDADIGRLRGDAQTKLKSVRSMLDEVPDPDAPPPVAGAPTGPVLDRNAATLHQTRQAIDGMLDGEQDGNVRRVLGAVRTQLDEILGEAVPDIKRIDSQYSELGRQRDAIERGQTVLDNGRTAPRPAELRDEVAASANPSGSVVGPSGVAFRLSQGARAEIDRLVGTKLNDRAALNSVLKGESDWNYDRLSTLFGRDKVDQLYKILDNERAMAETENMALANSKTAAVQAAQKEINGPGTKGAGALRSVGNLNFGDAAANVLDKVTGGISTARRNAAHEDIAQALLGRGEFTETSAPAGLSKTGFSLGALIDTIMQSAQPEQKPKKAPMTDQEFMDAVMRDYGT
ncbi:hypothetical protein [Aureimonas phyllosphaerae]|uniref:Uncharacterized protein n=1 Tax=Aureimonas phyllosphaerae TaxID=1166078 RepID=A0A7W6BWE0_9HYPH|nr:hypothetical protein [Aureimonas phyllosphaerae]MBB3938152.1 hypothetical protein [Aureimonas phyllosphaerae]MBB3962160.1 hypothetical protein [Aureimonas phyllosphaerae]SFF56635.1 hypothetical protein SAMN05216566_13020 [Aureimonas phyllosphaerae]